MRISGRGWLTFSHPGIVVVERWSACSNVDGCSSWKDRSFKIGPECEYAANVETKRLLTRQL